MSACGWEPSYVQCHSTDVLDSMSDTDRAAVEQMAIDLLWNWTGRVFGACPVEYRPCRAECGQGGFAASGWAANSPWSPVLVGGRWMNVSCGTCGDTCGCGGSGPLKLPWPVSSIEEVLIDGEVLDPAAYRLDSRSLLQRTDGGSWPSCQNLALPPTEPGTWQVSYLWGTPVPPGGLMSAGLLASELAMALCNDDRCQLPQRVQSITRQGVTVTLLDQFENVEKGRTGIWAVDAWVASVTKPRRGARVYSPDVPRKRIGS